MARSDDGRSARDDSRAAPSVFPGFDGMATDVGELIAELISLRAKQGLSQTDVAARMGTSQSAVARLEAGKADARLSTLERYATALGTSIRFAVGIEPQDEGPQRHPRGKAGERPNVRHIDGSGAPAVRERDRTRQRDRRRS